MGERFGRPPTLWVRGEWYKAAGMSIGSEHQKLVVDCEGCTPTSQLLTVNIQ